MLKIKTQTKKHLRSTKKLILKTLYKTIEFQALFKLIYIGILIFLINFVLGLFFDILGYVLEKLSLGQSLDDIKILSFFKFQSILVLSASLFIVGYLYLIEKNGVIIINSEYYRNNFISFFKALLLSIRKTPILIWRRINELKIEITVLVSLYVFWKIIDILELPNWIATWVPTILLLFGLKIFLSIIFYNNFSIYDYFLGKKERPNKTKKNVLRERRQSLVFFYTSYATVIITWIVLFVIIIKTLVFFSYSRPNFISFAIAFFISFTIISILIALSFFKTFKISLVTTLYFEKRPNEITIFNKTKQPLLSKKFSYALAFIVTIAFIGVFLLTTSIKTKTDNVIQNAEEYAEEIKERGILIPEDLTIEKLINEAISQDGSTLETIENLVITYFVFLVID